MPSLLQRFSFLAVIAAGAFLFGAGVQGVRGMDTTLQVAAQQTEERPTLVRYDERAGCDDREPRGPRV
jgi:hypothetical protein